MKLRINIFAALLLSTSVFAQSGAPVKQSGNVTPGQVPYWVTSGVIGDSVSSADSPVTSFGVTNNGGNGFCLNSARSTAAGRNALCFGVSTDAAATITLQNYGTATPQVLSFPAGIVDFSSLNLGNTISPNTGTILTVNNTTGNIRCPPNNFPSLEKLLVQVCGPNDFITGVTIAGYGTGFPGIGMYRSQGTSAIPSAVQTNDVLGVVDTHAYGTTDYFGGTPQIRFLAAQPWTDAHQGSAFVILTTPNNGTAALNTREIARFDQSGFVGFGSNVAAPASLLHLNNNAAIPSGLAGTLLQLSAADATTSQIQIDSFGSAGVQFSALIFRQAAGTGASPSQVQSGAIIGILGAQAYTSGSAFTGTAGQIRFVATQAQTAIAQGQAVGVVTTPNGSTSASAIETARFDQSGFLGLGLNPTAPASLLHLNNNAAVPASAAGTLLQVSAADGLSSQVQIGSFGAANVQFSSIMFRQSAGTAGSPTQVQANAIVGIIGASVYTNAAAYTASNAQVRFVTTEAQTAIAQGQATAIVTTPAGSATPAEAGRFQAGLSVGTTSDPGVGLIYTNSATFMLRTKTSLTSGAAAQTATLTNGPTAGNPTKWLPYDDNGTTRYIPAW